MTDEERRDADRTQQIDLMDRARFERLQALLGQALQALCGLRLAGELDEELLSSLRDALLAAGAGEREIDIVAVWLVTWIMQETSPSEKRRDYLEAIARHLGHTDVRVRISRDDQPLDVGVPGRAAVN